LVEELELLKNVLIVVIIANFASFFSQSMMFVFIYRMLHDIKSLLGEEDTKEKSP